ncbi:hypothetical protein KAU32_08685 [bacterium]|nr:hypothetical protein [bacterium]
MGALKKVLLSLLLIAFSVSICSYETPEWVWGNDGNKPYMTHWLADYIYSGCDGTNFSFLGGYFDHQFVTGATDLGVGTSFQGRDWGAYGAYYEYMDYDHLYMGSLIVSDSSGSWLLQGSNGNANDFSHANFIQTYFLQEHDYFLDQGGGPVANDSFWGMVRYDRHFAPRHAIYAPLESYCKIMDKYSHSPQGISVDARTFSYTSENANNFFESVALDWADYDINPAFYHPDFDNIMLKAYVITNNSDSEKEVFVTQRLDADIRTRWSEAAVVVDYEYSTGSPETLGFYIPDGGQNDDMAAWVEPDFNRTGNFGVIYDEQSTAGENPYFVLGVKLLNKDESPAGFKIISYDPAYSDIDSNGIDDNIPVAYAIDRPLGDSISSQEFGLMPWNPMVATYSDFVGQGFDSNTAVKGNYAIALTAGPYELEAGESKVVFFAIGKSMGDTLDAAIDALDASYDAMADMHNVGLNYADIAPPAAPSLTNYYEYYNPETCLTEFRLIWDPADFNSSETVPYAAGYQVFMFAGGKADFRFHRLGDNGGLQRLTGYLSNSPTSYAVYTSTSYVLSSTDYVSSASGEYNFGISAHDDAYYNYSTDLADFYSGYFNESVPAYLLEMTFEPYFTTAIGEISFYLDDNSNIFRLMWTEPLSREKDIEKYEITRNAVLAHTVYVQNGAYEYLQSAATDHVVYAKYGDEDYRFNLSDVTYIDTSSLTEVLIDLSEYNYSAGNNIEKIIVNNFCLQEIANSTPFTISTSDTSPVNYFWEGYGTTKTVFYETNTQKMVWESLDDWGATFYRVSDGSKIYSLWDLPNGYSWVQDTTLYLTSYPEIMVDWVYPELSGDITVNYTVKKYDYHTSLGELPVETGSVFTNPDYPTNLVAIDTNKSVTLTFNKASGDIFRYYVYRCSTAAIYDSVEPLDEDYIEKIGAVASTGADTYTFVDTYIDEYATYYYFVTSFNRTTDLESKPSNIATVSKDFDKEQNLELAHCVPNPFIYGTADALQENNHMVFVQLTENATITIYDIKGGLIRTIEHSATSETTYGDGGEKWDLMNEDGKAIATGLYFYVITNPDDDEDVMKGKLVIVR